MKVFRRRADRTQAALEERLARAVAELRPLLGLESGAVEVEEYRATEGVVVLRVTGGCPHCDMTAERLLQGIEAHLRLRVPAIRTVQIHANG